MDEILQEILNLGGVSAAMLFDPAGQLLTYRGQALYDRELCERLGQPLTRAVDAIKLEQEDWDSIVAQFADGKLIVRCLPASAGPHLLALVTDPTLNPSFATVAIRVAANKLRRALDGGQGSQQLGSSQRLTTTQRIAQPPPVPPPAAPVAAPPPPGPGSSQLASSGLTWSQASSSIGLSRVAVADPASAAFLSRCAKELARHVGPIAKVYVEEGVRRVCADGPFAIASARALIDDLSGQIEDAEDRAHFRGKAEKL